MNAEDAFSFNDLFALLLVDSWGGVVADVASSVN